MIRNELKFDELREWRKKFTSLSDVSKSAQNEQIWEEEDWTDWTFIIRCE
jgi:hypothetical protein